MAKGNGKGRDVQEQILEELRALNKKIGALREDVGQVNQRLDRVIENTGAHWRDLERRVAALEHSRSTK